MILFGAIWCNPCKAVKEYLAVKDIEYEYVDVDSNPEYISSIGIRGVPTLIDGDKSFTGIEPIKNYLEGK